MLTMEYRIEFMDYFEYAGTVQGVAIYLGSTVVPWHV